MKYGKALAAVLYAGLMAVNALSSGWSTAEGWVQIAAAVVTAVGVYFVPITTSAPWLKTAVASGLAVLTVLATAVVGGLDSTEVVLAIAAALGVWLAPADSGDASVGFGSDRLLP